FLRFVSATPPPKRSLDGAPRRVRLALNKLSPPHDVFPLPFAQCAVEMVGLCHLLESAFQQGESHESKTYQQHPSFDRGGSTSGSESRLALRSNLYSSLQLRQRQLRSGVSVKCRNHFAGTRWQFVQHHPCRRLQQQWRGIQDVSSGKNDPAK